VRASHDRHLAPTKFGRDPTGPRQQLSESPIRRAAAPDRERDARSGRSRTG
jgi:hypothetical protein